MTHYIHTVQSRVYLVHMMGLPLMSSDQILAVQSPTVRKCSGDVLIRITDFYISNFNTFGNAGFL